MKVQRALFHIAQMPRLLAAIAAFACVLLSGSLHGARFVKESDLDRAKGAGGPPVACFPGEDWAAHETNRIWTATAANEDGSFLVATANGDFVYTSTDHGMTWVPQTGSGSRGWWAVATSSSGQHVIGAVTHAQLHVSHDFGVTWTATESARPWQAVAMSANGSRLLAATDNGSLYTSDDSGATWTARIFAPHWRSVAMSASGMVQVAGDMGGFVYLSTDAGLTWSPQTSLGTGNWLHVACSSDGIHVAAAAFNGILYLSHDSGATWVQGQPFNSWHALSMSGSGSQIVAAAFNGRIYVSNDFGVIWTQTESTRNWHGLAMSGDGSIILAADYGGQLHTSECQRALEVVCPADFSVECGVAWEFGIPTASWNCGGNVTIVEAGTVTNGLCPRVVTRTWAVSDPCGNTNRCQQSVTILELRPPVFQGATNRVVPCGTAWDFETPSVSTACGGTNVSLRIVTTSTNGVCPVTFIRTWEAMDLCGNVSTSSQSVQIVDVAPPVMECGPDRIEVPLGPNCKLVIPELRPFAKDNCTPEEFLAYSQDPPAGTVVDGPCRLVSVRVTDLCGNFARCQVTVCGKDSTPPQLDCPRVIEVSGCEVPEVFRRVRAVDNCTSESDLHWSQSPPAGTPIAPGVTSVTVTVTDAAGNTSSCTIPIALDATHSFLDRLFNTGVDPNRVVLPNYSVDPHFELSLVPAGTPTTPGYYQFPDAVAVNAPWGFLGSSASKWIRPGILSSRYPIGEYLYSTRFVLPPGVDPATASISGRWAADDQAQMFLNGLNHTDFVASIATAPPAGFSGWTPFQLHGGLVAFPATNILHLRVRNLDSVRGHTGVRLEFREAIVGCQDCAPPAITVSPRSRWRPWSGVATMSVGVSGTPTLTYQWYFNGQPLTNGGAISGATSANLVVSPLQFSHSGQYSVVVSNACGTARSRPAALRVYRRFTWNWGWWTGSLNGRLLAALHGSELDGSGSTTPGNATGSSEEFGLPPLHGQAAPVFQPGASSGGDGWRIPRDGSAAGYSLLMDLHASASTNGSRVLFVLPYTAGKSSAPVHLVLGSDLRLRLTRRGEGGMEVDLMPPLTLDGAGWNRVGLVRSASMDPVGGPRLGVYLNGRPAGEVRNLPTISTSGPDGGLLFPAGSEETGDLFVAGIQFHEKALPPEWFLGLGAPNESELGSLQSGPADPTPMLRGSMSGGILKLDWMGETSRLQETSDLASGEWRDSELPFWSDEGAFGIRTRSEAIPDAANGIRYFRLIAPR